MTRPGLLIGDKVVDLRKAISYYNHFYQADSHVVDCTSLVSLLSSLESNSKLKSLKKELFSFIASNDFADEESVLPLSMTRLDPPVRPSKCLAVGGTTIKGLSNTISFVKPILKSGESVIGNEDEIRIPRGMPETRVSVELCILLGKRVKYASLHEARQAIAGYTVGNDVAATSLHELHPDLASTCKSLDTFAPIGPALVEPEDIDPLNVELSLAINGEVRAEENSGNFAFTPERIVRDISTLMTLHSGDAIFCGNIGEMPTVHKGDVVECCASGIGRLKNYVEEDDCNIDESYSQEFKRRSSRRF